MSKLYIPLSFRAWLSRYEEELEKLPANTDLGALYNKYLSNVDEENAEYEYQSQH